MADPAIIMKIARALGRASTPSGVGMLKPLSQAMKADPELTAFLRAAEEYSRGIPLPKLQKSAADYNDLLQAAMTYFKRGMAPSEYKSAAQRGVTEFLEKGSGAQPAMRGTKNIPIVPAVEQEITRRGLAEEGTAGLMQKARAIIEKASPRLRAYFEHVQDPSNPMPNISGVTLRREIEKLRTQLGGPAKMAPEKATKTSQGLAPEPPPPSEPGTSAFWELFTQKPLPGRPRRDPELLRAKLASTVPEGQPPTGAVARPAIPSSAIRGEYGPLDVPREQQIFEAFRHLFPDWLTSTEMPTLTQKGAKARRLLKEGVAPE